MKFHIIKNGEKIHDILLSYSITEEELKKENKHIKSWKDLIPGTKIKIPVIPESVDNDVIDMEPFIEDYYPINGEHFEDVETEELEEDNNEIVEDNSEELINNVDINEEKTEELIQEQREVNDEKVKVVKEIHYIYNNYYYFYNPYYGYIRKQYLNKKMPRVIL